MRTRALVALALLVCACGRGDSDAAAAAAGARPPSGPDPIVVRLPRDGGTVRAFRYPNLDSLIWRSQQATPAIERLLAFDAENGMLAYLGQDGTAGWLDLRLGTNRSAGTTRLASITSADGWSIFGVDGKNAVVRLTPSGDWSMATEGRVRRLFPLADGALIVLVDRDKQSRLLRLRPPDESVTDSVDVPRPDRAVVTPIGDRLYLSVKDELLSVQPRDFAEMSTESADDDILAMSPTPSGDRVFLATKAGPRLEVMNRYSEEIEGSVTLPGLVTELRMDPLGRYLLARPVTGDSAWVAAIATDALVGAIATAWRPDLPAVTVDGLIAAVQGDDVVFVDPTKGTVTRRAGGGASDLWFFMLWNGLRPRAQGVDVPVSFAIQEAASPPRAPDTTSQRPASAESTAVARRSAGVDSQAAAGAAREVPPPSPSAAPRDAWTVSFAAVLSESRARAIADGISVDGQRPRVVKGETAGTTVFRVIFGPYNSKADAERMGRASKHSYWVYEGVP